MGDLIRADDIQRARRAFLDTGAVPTGLAGSPVIASWQRSRDAGLDMAAIPGEVPHASAAQLARARERDRELLDHALPAMSYLHAQARDSGSVIVLANADGLLLQSCGDTEFAGRAARVSLSPGASWHEASRGTNAVGTALALREPVVITGPEHYLSCNGLLTCAAAPIAGSRGELLGVLDMSGDHRSRHPHTFSLVRAAAQMIENRLFASRHGGDIRLRFHPLVEGIGTLAEGVAAISPEGWLVGSNPAALALLGLSTADVGQRRVEQVFQASLALFMDWAARHPDEPLTLPRRGRPPLHVRIELPRRVFGQRPAPVAVAPVEVVVQDALSRLDSGDERMAEAIRRARRVLDKDIPLLVCGESGVGKELFARALHDSSARAGRAFVAVNCAALPEGLIEAELFGYTAGAFTGASRDGASGRIREADGGTLFLDEIGDMPLALQARLLRVLQERTVQPLGGGRAMTVDFALVCATHRDLPAAVAAGHFRADLYYRLNGLQLMLPPLRERSDFSRLVSLLIAQHAPEEAVTLTPALATAFARHSWPGNVRQLASALRTACALRDPGESQLDWHHLPEDLAAALRAPVRSVPASHPDNLRAQAEQTMLRIIASVQGNMTEAARRLGISRNTLYRRLRQAGGMGAGRLLPDEDVAQD